jgi:hypothetical protein
MLKPAMAGLPAPSRASDTTKRDATDLNYLSGPKLHGIQAVRGFKSPQPHPVNTAGRRHCAVIPSAVEPEAVERDGQPLVNGGQDASCISGVRWQ